MAGTSPECVRDTAPAAADAAPGNGSGDKVSLSALPDDVILRIISFMNARQAVRTCVLSQRWRKLWSVLPRINAEFFEFDTQTESMEVIAAEDDEVAFKRFVNRLLELRDPVALMDQFWLRYPSSDEDNLQVDSGEVNRWISQAIQKKARSVELVAMMLPLEVDSTMFTSRSLRTLGFCNVFLAHGFFKQLETGCPVLEDLYLGDCDIRDDEISSKSMKVLTIDLSRFASKCRTCISTPGVISLTLGCGAGNVPLLKNMPSLVTASVDLNDDEVQFDANDMQQFLWRLSDVQQLEFDYHGRQLKIGNNLHWCPEFNNLVSLSLDQWCLDANFYALTVFLQNSPRLKELTLKLGEFDAEAPERVIGELKERSFRCEHLKSVEVICLEDDALVNRVKAFFVENSMIPVQINTKHWSQRKHQLPAIFHPDHV